MDTIPCSTTSDALRLVESLQTFIVRRNETIERMQKEIQQLKREKNNLIEENRFLKSEKNTRNGGQFTAGVTVLPNGEHSNHLVDNNFDDEILQSIDSNSRSTTSPDSAINMSLRQKSGIVLANELDKLTLTLDESDGRRSNATTPEGQKNIKVKRSGSRGRQSVDNTQGRLNGYELSSDIKDKTIECLENRYGGKVIANNAATIIQQYYRTWKMAASFKRVRAFSEKRRKSVGCLVDTHVRSIRPHKSDPGSPKIIINALEVSIIDDDDNEFREDSQRIERLASMKTVYPKQEDNTTIDEPEVERSKSLPVQSSLSTDSNESPLFYRPDTDGEGSPESRRKFFANRDDSHGYDIIDDSNVMTVDYGHLLRTRSEDQESIAGYDPGNISYTPTVSKESYKRQFRIGVNLFNKKPQMGIDYLIDNALLDSDPKSIARFLRTARTVSKQKISEYFGSIRKEKNMTVLREFANSFDFTGKAVDEALRQFQSYFKLTGEAQSVERFVQEFSQQYVFCNPGELSDNPDTIIVLAFAIAMLNTDLHNENVKRKMTVEDFIRNLRGTNDGNDLPQQLLRDIYTRIQKNAFATGDDHTTQLKQIENSFIGKTPRIADHHRQFVKLFNLNEVYDPTRRDKPHQRFAFLFNDMLLLTKARIRPGNSGHGNGHVFSFKTSYKLLNAQVEEFSNEYYSYGVLLRSKVDMKMFACFNMMDETSRKIFVDELDEYIHETQGMENIRIVMSIYDVDRLKLSPSSLQTSRKKNSDKKRSLTVNVKRRSDSVSLNDLHMSKNGNYLDADDDLVEPSKAISSSMCNIVEAAEAENLRRSGSSTSIDNAYLNLETRTTSVVKSDTLPRSPQRKGIFPFGSRRRKSQETLQQPNADQARKSSPLPISTLAYGPDKMRVDLV